MSAEAPFEILADPNSDKFSVRDITPPKGVSMQRVDQRKSILAQIDQLQQQADLQPAAYEALDEHYKMAHRMITSPETIVAT